MEIYIRKAVIEDFAAVRNIIQQVHDMHVNWRPDIHRRNDDLFTTEYFEKFLAEDAFYVAVTDGRVVGVLSLVFRHIESPAHVTRDVVFIDTMAVDEGYRGRGIGHLFFETVKEIKTSGSMTASNCRSTRKTARPTRCTGITASPTSQSTWSCLRKN